MDTEEIGTPLLEIVIRVEHTRIKRLTVLALQPGCGAIFVGV
jgi:hypothetical protein